MTSRDRIAGGLLVAVSIAYFLAGRGLPEGREEPGPAFFPTLLAAALGVVALVILLRPRATKTDLPPLNKSLVVIVATIAYIVAFVHLGYWTSTLSYTFVMVVVASPRRDWRWLTIPVMTSLLVYGLFVEGLGLPLLPP